MPDWSTNCCCIGAHADRRSCARHVRARRAVGHAGGATGSTGTASSASVATCASSHACGKRRATDVHRNRRGDGPDRCGSPADEGVRLAGTWADSNRRCRDRRQRVSMALPHGDRQDECTLEFDVSAETLRCTTGLERPGGEYRNALRLSDRLGGHLIPGNRRRGHCQAIRRSWATPRQLVPEVERPPNWRAYRREGIDRGGRGEPHRQPGRRRALRRQPDSAHAEGDHMGRLAPGATVNLEIESSRGTSRGSRNFRSQGVKAPV